MELATCTVCCTNKTAMLCDLCNSPSCKKCSYYVDAHNFDMHCYLPENIQNKAFCPNCYNESVAELIDTHSETLELANKVDVYDTTQGSETRLIHRVADPISVEECADREETLLRLAFLAARDGFGTIVDVDIRKKKVGENSYKKYVWSGKASPVNPKLRRRFKGR